MLTRLEIILALVGTAAGRALLAQKQKVPYGILLVIGGLFLGWNLGWRSPLIHQAQTRLQVIPVWETIQFLLNGWVFILIGLELPDNQTTM